MSSIKKVKFTGWVMELTLVLFNIVLVLFLIFLWQNMSNKNSDKAFEDKYVKVGEQSQGTK